MKQFILAGGIFCLSAVAAMAQSTQPVSNYDQAVRDGVITSGGSDQGPGNLSARDVVGKRLLDANGNPIGMIRRVSADGRTAVVAPTGGGPRIDVDMAKLGLGMGAHTVIEEDNHLPQRQPTSTTTQTTSYYGYVPAQQQRTTIQTQSQY